MGRRLTGLIGAGLCALLGTFLLISYVHSAEARATTGDKLVDVLVVTHEIKAGTPAKDLGADVKPVQVPAKVEADGAVHSLTDLEGLVATVNLVPGEQIVRARFSKTADRAGVPDGLLQVTISLDPERALGGRIANGDTVAVVVSMDKDDKNPPVTHMILHNVLVTNVQLDSTSSQPKSDGKTSVAPTGKLLVTLAVDAPSVERVVFGAEHGHVWLSQEPQGASHAGTQIVTEPAEFGA